MFITFRLHGSLPPSRFPPPNHKLSAGKAFVWVDRYLDTTRQGPLFLKDPEVAAVVAEALRFGMEELKHYELQAWAVMPNHVHILALPLVDPGRFLQTIKGFTARECNKLLGRTGEPFWQKESYDHWVRDEPERLRIIEYIESNPVKAGLCATAEHYLWSSAARKPYPPLDYSKRGLTNRRK